MMTRQNGYGDKGSVLLDRPMSRSILLQRHVRARLVVVCRIGGENSPQVRFAKKQHLVEALAAQGVNRRRTIGRRFTDRNNRNQTDPPPNHAHKNGLRELPSRLPPPHRGGFLMFPMLV